MPYVVRLCVGYDLSAPLVILVSVFVRVRSIMAIIEFRFYPYLVANGFKIAVNIFKFPDEINNDFAFFVSNEINLLCAASTEQVILNL